MVLVKKKKKKNFKSHIIELWKKQIAAVVFNCCLRVKGVCVWVLKRNVKACNYVCLNLFNLIFFFLQLLLLLLIRNQSCLLGFCSFQFSFLLRVRVVDFSKLILAKIYNPQKFYLKSKLHFKGKKFSSPQSNKLFNQS